MPQLAIVIPVYNAAKYINRCLDSIFNNEPNLDMEVICVDDGSKDDSLKLLNEYSKREPRLTVVSQKNRGASTARNKGIDLLSIREGVEWLMFIDSDDYVNCSFRSMISEATKNDVDIAVSGLYRVSRSGDENCTKLHRNIFRCEDLYNLVLKTDTLSLGSPCCKIFKFDIIRKHNLRFRPDMKLFEDASFVYNYLGYCNSAMTTDLVFYCYDVKEVSTGGNYHGDVFWTCLQEYIAAQNAFTERFAKDQKAIDQLNRHHFISVIYNVLYAFYAIYRCENRPKHKYTALKQHIANFEQITGRRLTYPSGFPRLFSTCTSIHPILGHLLLLSTFSIVRLKSGFKTTFQTDNSK